MPLTTCLEEAHQLLLYLAELILQVLKRWQENLSDSRANATEIEAGRLELFARKSDHLKPLGGEPASLEVGRAVSTSLELSQRVLRRLELLTRSGRGPSEPPMRQST